LIISGCHTAKSDFRPNYCVAGTQYRRRSVRKVEVTKGSQVWRTHCFLNEGDREKERERRDRERERVETEKERKRKGEKRNTIDLKVRKFI
jgi:hypothetical protein